ncbi:MAG: dTMP kinase [Myxococcota bacterium]|nr:dTMP kinase [Myxococcota bacterium]
MNRGRLVAFEGIDGCGKSTQLARFARALEQAGHEPTLTREPTDGPWGRRIRAMARSGERVAPEEELRWFVEDRREHADQVLRPALDAGRVVVTDRYYLSTVAYQGARGLDAAALLAEAEAEFPAPDLALVFHVDPEQGLARVAARGEPEEPAFEELAFLRRVARNFRALERDYVAHLDGSGDEEAIARAVLRATQHVGLP